ncbi:MAG: hypothetical protein IJL98_06645 [Lachnospiraceae bacterium]|nr:hypothetical protein [Lachnospiraceae bacterium]
MGTKGKTGIPYRIKNGRKTGRKEKTGKPRQIQTSGLMTYQKEILNRKVPEMSGKIRKGEGGSHEA